LFFKREAKMNLEAVLDELAEEGHEVDLTPVQAEDGRIYYRIDGTLRSEDEILQMIEENHID
jgi:hypothetical protein